MTMLRAIRRRLMVAALLLLAGLASAACGALDVSDPTAIEDEELNDAAGAELVRLDALSQFSNAVVLGVLTSGLLADEFFADPPAYYQQYGIVSMEDLLDRRNTTAIEQYWVQSSGLDYYRWQLARRTADLAMPKLEAYGGSVGRVHVGEMLAVRGFAALKVAEDFCPGFPLHDVTDYKVTYGGPLTTAEALGRAIADFDSTIVLAADSDRIANFARVGRGRALLALGRFADAAAAVADVPLDYRIDAEYDANLGGVQRNILTSFGVDGGWGISEHEGGTGLDFVSANDPRVVLDSTGLASDSATIMYAMAKYPDGSSPIVVASGVEAKLIEAEAALAAGGDWRGLLNQIRASQPSLGLGPLSDPGSPEARLDLVFRERAFWLFGTGHRLADVRRLIGVYGRDPSTTYPSGPYFRGGAFGNATSIPFPAALEAPFSPTVTSCVTP